MQTPVTVGPGADRTRGWRSRWQAHRRWRGQNPWCNRPSGWTSGEESSCPVGHPPLVCERKLLLSLRDQEDAASHRPLRRSEMTSRAGRNRPASTDCHAFSRVLLSLASSSPVGSSPGSARRNSSSVPSGRPGGASPMILPFSTRTLIVSISTCYWRAALAAMSAASHRLPPAELLRDSPETLCPCGENHVEERIMPGFRVSSSALA